MVAVERIGQYMKLPSEAPLTIEGSVPSKDWPSQGAITIRNLTVRFTVSHYRNSNFTFFTRLHSKS